MGNSVCLLILPPKTLWRSGFSVEEDGDREEKKREDNERCFDSGKRKGWRREKAGRTLSESLHVCWSFSKLVYLLSVCLCVHVRRLVS